MKKNLGVISLISFSLVILTLAQLSTATAQTTGTEKSITFPVKEAKVKTVLEADIYTYMAIEQPNGNIYWVTSPVCAVKEGDTVSILEGKYYAEITSEPLGITFENFIVATKLEINGKAVKAFSGHDLPKGCVRDKK